MTVRDRLIQFLDHLGMGRNAFEDKCELPSGCISHMTKGMRTDNLAKIAATYPDLNIRWLLTGNGDMLKSNDLEEETSDMEHTISERIHTVIEYSGFTPNGFEAACGLTRGTIASLNKGMRSDKIALISKRFPEISMTWLLTGNGEMLKKAERQSKNEEQHIQTISLLRDVIQDLREQNKELKEENRRLREKKD